VLRDAIAPLAEVVSASIAYAAERPEEFSQKLIEHLQLSGTALILAVAISVPAGVWIVRRPRTAQPVIGVFNSMRVVPSLAVLFLALPLLGLGFVPAVVALTLLACPPVLLNTYAGYRGVSPAVVEAAEGMGMAPRQILRRIETPLAAPVVLAGVRIAAVEVIASATLAAFIGGGGLGDYVFRGWAVNRVEIMLVGALPVAVLTLLAEATFILLQRSANVPQ
jgi:osmoprotectant transport system permease protein